MCILPHLERTKYVKCISFVFQCLGFSADFVIQLVCCDPGCLIIHSQQLFFLTDM